MTAPPDDGSSAAPALDDAGSQLGAGAPAGRARLVARIAGRVLIMGAAIAAAVGLLYWAFDDLDPREVIDSVRSLDDAEVLALVFGTAVLVWSEALLTASVVPGLPARRGALAWLGPVAVASVVPGPSDMPVRYKMFVSWGYSPSTAGTGVAAGGVLNIVMKLVFPAVAAVGLAVARVPMGRILSTVVTGLVIVAVIVGVFAVIVASERRTQAAGRLLDRLWGATMRVLGQRRDGAAIATWLVARRAQSLDVLRGRWTRAIASGVFVSATRVSLMVMSLRFMGVPESELSWQAIFCVWAIQRGLTIIPLMPGGAGVTELALTTLFTAFAGQEFINQITAGVLVFRIATWLVLIPAGGVALALWRLGLRQRGAPPDDTVSAA